MYIIIDTSFAVLVIGNGVFFMLPEDLFAEYLLECEIRKFTPKTIRGYKNCIELLIRYCKEKYNVTKVKDVSHLHIEVLGTIA